jgi:hypothetical protein
MTSPTRSPDPNPSRRTVLVAAAAAGLLGPPGPSSARAATTNRPPPLRLPVPTGPYRVGRRASYVVDPARLEPVTGGPRTLPVHVWYPANRGRLRVPGTAPYLSPVLRQVYEAAFGLPPGTLAIDTHADAGARPLPVRGVLLMSGGLGLPTAFQTAQAVELASRGWAVVAVEHPHDTYRTELPGGVVVDRTLPDTAEGGRQAFAARMLDIAILLKRLPALVPGPGRGLPAGMFGHSIGGAAAVEAAYQFAAVSAAVDLDGTPRGDVVTRGTDEPVGIMLSNVRDGLPPPGDTNLALLLANLRGPNRVRHLTSIGHDGFTDFAVLTPQALAADPATGALLAGAFDTQVETVAEGLAVVAAQRGFLARFFDRHLPGAGR